MFRFKILKVFYLQHFETQSTEWNFSAIGIDSWRCYGKIPCVENTILKFKILKKTLKIHNGINTWNVTQRRKRTSSRNINNNMKMTHLIYQFPILKFLYIALQNGFLPIGMFLLAARVQTVNRKEQLWI